MLGFVYNLCNENNNNNFYIDLVVYYIVILNQYDFDRNGCSVGRFLRINGLEEIVGLRMKG